MAEASGEPRLTVGYTRCSSRAQDLEDKAFGRPTQQRAISAWAEMQDETIDLWIHDTCSGATLDREGITEVRALAARGRLARLVFARQDRLARDAHLADTLYREIEAEGGELINVQIKLEKSMVGKILRRILDNFAELDRFQIVERCRKGRLESILRHGTHMYGSRILGYRQVPRAECDQLGLPRGSLRIEEREAEVVRTIYALRERGHAYGAIASWLNERGHPSRGGGRYAQTTVAKIVGNEGFYRAERVSARAEVLGLSDEEYANVKPAHPAILPPREQGQLLLVDRVPRFRLLGAAIPDDPLSDAPLMAPKRSNIRSLTQDYAAAVLMVRDGRAAGASWAKIVEQINEAGHRTRTGGRFGSTTAIRVSRRMTELEPLALEALARATPDAAPIKAKGWDEPARMAHQMARRGLGRGTGQTSLAKIAAALNAEYGATPYGGRYHAATVSRLLAQTPAPADSLRTVAYARFTVEGEDHHGQIDLIGEWAALNGLKVAEWYIDRAPAYSRADNPALIRLLEDSAKGSVHRVAVLASERFCRDAAVADDVTRRLSAHAEVFFIGDAGSGIKRRQKRKRPPFVPLAG